jgi:hypothetical protein
VRWDRLWEDLEDQLDSEWEAERAALDSEAERLRLSRLGLRERLAVLADPGTANEIVVETADGSVLSGGVGAVGADWLGLDARPASARTLVPLSAILTVGLGDADLLRTARGTASDRPRGLAERMSLGFVLRDLARRRLAVGVRLIGGRTLAGTIDRAGADHLDLALHEPGSARRTSAVTGYRVVPFTALAWVRVDAPAGLG